MERLDFRRAKSAIVNSEIIKAAIEREVFIIAVSNGSTGSGRRSTTFHCCQLNAILENSSSGIGLIVDHEPMLPDIEIARVGGRMKIRCPEIHI